LTSVKKSNYIQHVGQGHYVWKLSYYILSAKRNFDLLNKEVKILNITLIKAIARPLITRCGTLLGAYLTGMGVATQSVDSIVLGATLGCGILIDLLTRRFIK